MVSSLPLLPPDDPRNVACPECGAKEGALCLWPNPNGFGERVPSGLSHVARRKAAKEAQTAAPMV